MRKLPIIITAMTLVLSGCEDKELIAEQAKIEASMSWVSCSNGMFFAQSAHREGKSGDEIRQELYKCNAVGDDLFIEKALEEFERVTRFKDPSSVQYEGLRRGYNPNKVEGKYNAKNSYGAYTGFKSFTIEIPVETGGWDVRIDD